MGIAICRERDAKCLCVCNDAPIKLAEVRVHSRQTWGAIATPPSAEIGYLPRRIAFSLNFAGYSQRIGLVNINSTGHHAMPAADDPLGSFTITLGIGQAGTRRDDLTAEQILSIWDTMGQWS